MKTVIRSYSDGKNSYFLQMSVAGGTSVNQIVVANREITKSGYVYIYVSNESKDFKVYFAVSRKTKWFGNNLKVTHVRGPLLSEEGYYPFGMSMSAISSTAGTVARNNYKFNAGTELTESFDINYYETYFRQYDAQLGRFTGVDALAEQTFSWSPYQFGYNNPAMFNDPTGLQSDYSWFWNQIIDRANNSRHGFTWENTGLDDAGNYGTLTPFGSYDQAFGFGIGYMNQTGGWGSYSWWANSPGQALQRYGSAGVTPGMVTGYYMNKWYGTGRQNISASYAGGIHLGKGFNVGFDYDGALGTPTVGSLYVSNSQIQEIFKGSSWLKNINEVLTPLGYGTAGFEYQLGSALAKYNRLDRIKRYNEDWMLKHNPYLKTRTVNVEIPIISRHVEVPRNVVKNASRGLQGLGAVTGVVSAINDINSYNSGEISGAHLTINLIMNGVGFLGPWGAGVSILYGVTEKYIWNE